VILLDTQVLIWLAISPERISSAAAAAIQQAGSMGESPQISAVSLYEVANAIRRGRIQPAMPIRAFLDRLKSRFTVIPVSEKIAIRAGELSEPFHGDPMDRMIAATAIMEKCTLITSDSKIRAANVCKVLW
jgi:PIN domain nuclease of toxin-antitoxin system